MADVLRFDLAKDPKGNPIIYGRVGDGGSFTREVRVFEDGKPLDLTGWTTTFEGNTSKYQTKVFDSYGIKILNAKNGEFSYTFPNMAFAVEGQYERAYFSFTNGDKRKSTGNFEIIVLGNADIDAPEAETIITEYNKLIAELQELQKNNIADLQEQAETIQTRLSELAKRLDELELGVRLHDAYAWSADGTDRFTKVYPRENLVDRTKTVQGYVSAIDGSINPPSAYNNELITDYLPVDPGQAMYMQQRVILEGAGDTAQEWLGIGYYDENKMFLNRVSGTSQLAPVGTEIYFEFRLTAPANARFMRISWRNFSGSKVKVEKGNTPTIYTPAPSEDPINAYPTYKGISIVDSDNPADYSWQAEDNTIAKKATLDSHTENISNPHKVTKTQIGLGNVDNYSTATQAEAEAGAATNKVVTPLGVKQNVDKRIATQDESEAGTSLNKLVTPLGIKQYTDKRLASDAEIVVATDTAKLVTPKNLETFYEDRQKIAVARYGLSDVVLTAKDKLSDASWRYRRIGNEVEFFGRFNFSSATDIVNVHALPTGFRLSADFDDTSWNLPLTVSKATNPTLFLASGFVERIGTNLLRIGCNATGNTYWYGSWYTDDPFPAG